VGSGLFPEPFTTQPLHHTPLDSASPVRLGLDANYLGGLRDALNVLHLIYKVERQVSVS